MTSARTLIAASVACGLSAFGSPTFAQSLTAPAGIPSDAAPGGGTGIAEVGQERRLSPPFAPDADVSTAAASRSRWNGIHRLSPND